MANVLSRGVRWRLWYVCDCWLCALLVSVINTRSKLRKVLFLALGIFLFFILFVNQISRELLSGFAPNSQGRRVWSLARTSLNVKVKGQGDQGQKRTVQSHHPLPWQWRNRTRSLQITLCSSRRDHSVAAGGDFGGLHAVYVWQNVFSSSYYFFSYYYILL